MLTLLALLLVVRSDPFIVDAEWRDEFTLGPRALYAGSVIGSTEFLARMMPGVTEIRSLPEGEFLYRTERSMPFAGVVRTDFRIRREEWTDSSVVFRTPSAQEANYMILSLRLAAERGRGTVMHVLLRVRLTREDGADIHPFAPVLGEAFMSGQMERELRLTVQTFAGRINAASPLWIVTGQEAAQ
jgi:hypothetical protein